MHANETRDLDLLARARVVDELAFAHRTLVDPHVRQLSEASLLELERKRDKRGSRSGRKFDRGSRNRKRGVVSGDLGLSRRGQVRADAVKEGLHSGVLDCRAEEDGRELQTDSRAADGLCELGRRRVLVHDEQFADFIVDLRELLDELATLLLGELEGLRGDLIRLDDLVALLTLVVDSLPANEVDHTAEIVLDTDGNLDCCRSDLEFLPDLIDDAPRVCTGTEGFNERCTRAGGQEKAPYRSILLMKEIRGTLYRRICLSTVVV